MKLNEYINKRNTLLTEVSINLILQTFFYILLMQITKKKLIRR